jgi:hypothetical protein
MTQLKLSAGIRASIAGFAELLALYHLIDRITDTMMRIDTGPGRNTIKKSIDWHCWCSFTGSLRVKQIVFSRNKVGITPPLSTTLSTYQFN